MSTEDQPTEQLRRTPATPGMPRPLDVTSPTQADDDSDSTEVLPIDELFGSTAARPPTNVAPVRSEPVDAPPAEPVEALPPEPTPATANTATPAAPAAQPQQPSVADRLRADAQAALHAGRTRGRVWIGSGDNVLIVATVLIAILLITVIAAL